MERVTAGQDEISVLLKILITVEHQFIKWKSSDLFTVANSCYSVSYWGPWDSVTLAGLPLCTFLSAGQINSSSLLLHRGRVALSCQTQMIPFKQNPWQVQRKHAKPHCFGGWWTPRIGCKSRNRKTLLSMKH